MWVGREPDTHVDYVAMLGGRFKKKKKTDGGVIIRQVLSDVAQFAVKKAFI